MPRLVLFTSRHFSLLCSETKAWLSCGGESVGWRQEKREEPDVGHRLTEARDIRGFANSQETLPLFQRAPCLGSRLGEAPCPPTSHQKNAGISNQDGPGRANKRLFSKVWADCWKVPKNSAVTRVQETELPAPGPTGTWGAAVAGCGRVTWRGPPLENGVGGGAQSAPGDPTGRGPLPREDPYLAKPGFRARAPPGLQQACGWGAQ